TVTPAVHVLSRTRRGQGKMRVPTLWLFSFFMITEGWNGFLGSDDGIKTKQELILNKKKSLGPFQEYELLFQVAYRDSKEKRDVKNFLKLLEAYPLFLPGPVKIIRAKATTYCGIQNGVLRCACDDGYSWFPPLCLDPQKCYLHTEGSVQSCDCHLNNLTQSVHFCERTKVWGTFKINERFTKDLLDSSSALYSKYTTEIEIQKRTKVSKVLSQFKSPSFAQCNSIVFGFGSKNDKYTLPCSSGYSGSITARCQPSGWHVLRETCVLSELEELKKNFSVIASNATEATVSSLVQNLSMVILENPSTTAGNLASVVSILGNISSLSLERHFNVSISTMEVRSHAVPFAISEGRRCKLCSTHCRILLLHAEAPVGNVINISDHVLNSASVTNWTVLLQKEKNAGSQLLASLENISVLVPSTALPLEFSREFINWKGIPASSNQSNLGYNYQTEMFPENTSIPIRGHALIRSDQFQKPLPETIISMTSLTLGNILPVTKNGNAQVNGPVISMVIPNYSISEIFLTFSKIESNLSQPHCVFWDFNHSQWNDNGCHLVNETPDSVTCRCTHLTSFSMLMSPSVPTAIVPVVKWITFVGLGVSIGSLILCLTIEALFWKQVNKSQTSHTRHICMVNIALCLLIADIWFIVAATVDTAANPSGVCTAAVFFTHFFYLSLFFWMLMLGFLLAYRVILVFHHMATPSLVAVGFCLGYGCPLIISIITIAVTQPSNGYERKDVCWLNWSDGSKPLLAFAGPALTIVAVNLVVVLLVLTKLWRPAVGERLTQDSKATVVRMGRSLLVLTPLLGLTWGFGIGTIVDSRNLAWHVIFASLNASQGFFILCFGMLLDSKLRQLLLNKLSPLSFWNQASKQKSSDSSVKPRFEKTFNPFQHERKYVLSYTGESSNDIKLTQFSSSE
ncbi:hypothetical protein E2I00_004470, partial [Balaenoptera physalus]